MLTSSSRHCGERRRGADAISQPHLLSTLHALSGQAAKGMMSQFGSSQRACATGGRVGPVPREVKVILTLKVVNTKGNHWVLRYMKTSKIMHLEYLALYGGLQPSAKTINRFWRVHGLIFNG